MIHPQNGGQFQVSINLVGKPYYVGTYATHAEAVLAERVAIEVRVVTYARLDDRSREFGLLLRKDMMPGN